MQLARTFLSLLGAATLAAAVPSVEVKGNYFINNATGDRYQIVGVAYQPGGSAGYSPTSGVDPLSSKDLCLRDAAIMQVLGVNAIRVYNIDPDLNHDDCASIFNAAGILMFLDVNSPLPGESLNSAAPWTSYYAGYLNRTFAVVEAFKSYPNTAGFLAGNEVISTPTNGAIDPPYIRAVTRDLKNYISKHSNRTIPVGYSAADVRDVLFDTWAYLQCSDATDGATNDPSRLDFFSLNSYSWCGNSSFEESTYNELVEGFQKSSVPVFFSEYGCNQPSPRVFTEVPEIYSDQMSAVFSGGIVYEYAQGVNDYGLVNISSDGTAQLLDDFYTLKDRYAALNFTAIQGMAPPSNSPPAPACGSSLITTEGFTANFTIPDVPPGAQDIIDNGVSLAPSGRIVAIDDYSVKYEVRDNNGKAISGLMVATLSEDQINQPGVNSKPATGTSLPSSTTSSTAVASTTATEAAAPSATSSQSAATNIRDVQHMSIPLKMIPVVISSFIIGMLL